jgi:ADP-ribose pyrophosphatase
MNDELTWMTLDDDLAYEAPDFKVVREKVALPDGTCGEFEFVRESDTVVVLAITPQGDVVVIEEWRQSVRRVSRGLPAGTVEPADETIEAAAARELWEETGYQADRFEVLTQMEPANGFYDARFHYVLAEDATSTASRCLDADESIRVETQSYEDLLDAVLAGEITDGRSGYGILWLAANPDKRRPE